MHAHGSEVSRLREQIQAEYEAAERGFTGLASGVTRHAFITARMERIGRCHEELVALLGPEAAIALVAGTLWHAPGPGACHPPALP